MFKEIGLQAQNKITILINIFFFWGGGLDLYDDLMSSRIFIFITNKIFIQAPKIMKKVAMASIWICYTSRTNCVFHILGEVGYLEKVTI